MDECVTDSQTRSREQLLEGFFLPDLCNTRAVLILLIVSEALVLALTLIETGIGDFSWMRFGIVSLFVQWVALVSVAVLCQLRSLLARVPVWAATLIAMLLIQLVTLGVSLLGETALPRFQAQLDWLWVARNQLVSAIFSAMALRYFYVQSQWRLQTQAELRSRLAALQANIRPHFFFNTLNTVASLIIIDPDKAEQMLLELAQLFRAVLKGAEEITTLEEEIKLGQGYLDIEQTRLGERMTVVWDLPHSLPALRVPQLILQPLLENAVYHGIQPSIQGGEIHISLTSEKAAWQLLIRNSKEPGDSDAGGNRIALQNIRSRLDAHFGEGAGLEVADLDTYFEARIILPVREERR
ncbi:alginate biosynthesis two-component system sensor histidine kinase AlgZ [Thalassolituus maritimus]|uniref:Alginate biosynthesis two-component system sensor histidine kinase AlgZ n=1 Tax=Thalassolituus maritimus TaxID=484498 RepID=A0ABP9ZXT0_9GAMM